MESVEFITKSHFVFIQVGQLDMFKKHSSKLKMLDKYYSTEEVIAFMNKEPLRVCILDKNENVIEANF